MLAKIVQQNQQLAEAVRTSKRDHDKMERELRDEIRSLKESVKGTSTEIIEPRNKKAKVKVAVSNKCKVGRLSLLYLTLRMSSSTTSTTTSARHTPPSRKRLISNRE